MLGTMRFLACSLDPGAAELRRKYIFKIIPMLNVDGVVNGWYVISTQFFTILQDACPIHLKYRLSQFSTNTR